MSTSPTTLGDTTTVPSWYYFPPVAAGRCHGLRSVALVGLSRCDDRLHTEAEGDREPRGCYRVLPDAEAVAWQENLGGALNGVFQTQARLHCMPWVVRVGSHGLCGATSGEDYEDRLLECSQVVLQRLTSSNRSSDWYEGYSQQLIAAWETWT
jgi:hypothetical protein